MRCGHISADMAARLNVVLKRSHELHGLHQVETLSVLITMLRRLLTCGSHHVPKMSFSIFFFCCKLYFCRNQKTKRKNNLTMFIFYFMQIESSQYGSPQNSTCYTKVMNIFHTFTHLNDIRIHNKS